MPFRPAPRLLDGYQLMGQFFMGGQRSAHKARTSLEAWVKRTRKVFAQKGIGSEDTYGAPTPPRKIPAR